MKGKYMVCLMLAIWSANAAAHFVWLERDDNGSARAYFGEWDRDVREKTGGALDRIKSPRSFIADADKVLPIERRADHLEIITKAAGDVRLVETGLAPREDKKNGGKTRTVFQAKAGRSNTGAMLDLELVPESSNANRFTLMFRGKPLAKTDVTVFGPPKWQKSLQTDDAGRVTIETPWKGRYVVEVTHIDDKPGEIAGEAFDRTRNVFTLSFVSDQGQPW